MIYRDGKKIFTKNLIPGKSVYNEPLIQKNDNELRRWIPQRSKLAAAIVNGLDDNYIKKGDKVLYLGASTGTTLSHISDIVGKEGIVYGIEFAERVIGKLIKLAKERKNIVPLLADARKMNYGWVETTDVVYTDIADPQETEITIRNADRFMKKDGFVLIAVKSQSIDVTKSPKQVYEEEAQKLKKAGYQLLEQIKLDPYEKKHAMLVAKK